MLIVALNGSPNREGNTAYLLNEALRVVRASGAESMFIQVSEGLDDVKETFCLCCSSPCAGRCYKDTGLAKMLDVLRHADGIIMGSPVHFGTVSAQIKSFWDKTRMLRYEKALVNVVGGAIAVGSSRYGGQETTLRALQDMMFSQGMTLVGDGHVDSDAGHRGVCARGPARDDLEALERARLLARRVLEVAGASGCLRLYRNG